MAMCHDKRSPVRNALLKWQLQQDEQRVAKVRHRLMQMASPSPSLSLGINNSSFDRRSAARRPRLEYDADQEKAAVRTLMVERDEREKKTANHSVDRFQASKLQYPLPPLRHSKAPTNNSVKNFTLRSAGKPLNAAENLNAFVRAQDLQDANVHARQDLTIPRIRAPTLEKNAVPSSKGTEMKTQDKRWKSAMWPNFEEVDPLTSQLPEQPVVCATGDFCERFSRSQSHSHDSSCYEIGPSRPPSPLALSELSAMSIGERTKQSATQHSSIGSPAADVAGSILAPILGQSIAEMLASMEKLTEAEYAGYREAGDDQHYAVSSDGDGDRKQFLRDEFSPDDALFARDEVLSGIELSRCSTIVVVCCLVIGACGFFIEEFIGLVGLFSKRTQFLLSRADQERMRVRMSILQQEVQGFQLLTSKIEASSQAVLAELRQYMHKMQLNREKHQKMLANEMQKLRHHILHVTHELIEQERESFRTQLKGLVKVQVINDKGADDNVVVAGDADYENKKQLKKTTTETPIQAESYLTMHEFRHEAIASSPISTREENGEQFCVKRTKVEPSRELVTKDSAVVSSAHIPSNVDNKEAHIRFAENGPEPVRALSRSITGEHVNVQLSEGKLESSILVLEARAEHAVEAEPASVSSLEPSLNKIDDTVASVSKVNVMPSRNASEVSWDGILVLVGIVFFAACVVLRIYNTNRRKLWFEKHRKRKNQRALRLAQRRARAMAEYQEDSSERVGHETDGDIEEVSLMAPLRDNEEDERRQKLQHHSSDIDIDTGRHR